MPVYHGYCSTYGGVPCSCGVHFRNNTIFYIMHLFLFYCHCFSPPGKNYIFWARDIRHLSGSQGVNDRNVTLFTDFCFDFLFFIEQALWQILWHREPLSSLLRDCEAHWDTLFNNIFFSTEGLTVQGEPAWQITCRLGLSALKWFLLQVIFWFKLVPTPNYTL